MTNNIEEEIQLDNTKNQPLTGMQKLLFGMLCWGVQTRSQIESFKANGYDRKYRDARKAMYTGFVIYGLGFILFILILFYEYGS